MRAISAIQPILVQANPNADIGQKLDRLFGGAGYSRGNDLKGFSIGHPNRQIAAEAVRQALLSRDRC